MAFPIYMRADLRQAAGGEMDFTPLLGVWINTNSGTDYLRKLLIRQEDGALLVHVYGAADPDPVDWGETRAIAYASGGTREAAGFHARYGFGTVETQLAANQKLGILVIQSYTSFADGSGRQNHYAREFFRRQGGAL